MASGLTILLNPAFQPAYGFAALNYGDNTLSVYDFNQRAMTQLSLSSPVNYGLLYNADGAELYSGGFPSFWHRTPSEVLAVNLANDSIEAAIQTSGAFGSGATMSLSVNPANGNPAIYLPARGSSGKDLVVLMIDTNPSSKTFNTVIKTLNAGLGKSPIINSAAATPDGKYVYVNFYYLASGSEIDDIAIFDVVNGGNATLVSTASLGVQAYQLQTYVTPDGRSLLLAGISNGASAPIAVFDIGGNPENPTLVTTIAGTPPGGEAPYYFEGYQVVGSHLFAYDGFGRVVAFDFDRNVNNYQQLSSYLYPGPIGGDSIYFTVAPDGAYVYAQFTGDDAITVLDANALVNGQPPLLTRLVGDSRRPRGSSR